MITLRGMACCGTREIVDLSHHGNHPTEALKCLLKPFMAKGNRHGFMPNGRLVPRLPAFFIFTQARNPVNPEVIYGDRFAAKIEELELGEVTVSSENRNLNSGNLITTYTWMPDVTAIKR